MNESEPSSRTTLTIAQVIETYQAARRLEVALAAHGVTVFLVAVMGTIANAPVVRLHDIGDVLGVAPSLLTIGLDRLEQRGLVARVRSDDIPVDRRVRRVALTDAGRAMLAELAEIEVNR